jgi:N-methylhydantoinase A
VYRVGIDVGGTFTDIVVIDQDGHVTLAKVSSTPSDPSVGVLEGLAVAAGILGLDRRSMLEVTSDIVHGTTVATNALLEHKGARVGMLTTEGHRDIIEMREGYKDDRYNLRMAAPDPLVPRHLRLGVRERIRSDGSIHAPLDADSLDRAIAVLLDNDIEAVAICYLHSYRNPIHEKRTEEAVRKALPHAYVSTSSTVLPQIKEYERFCTTVVNAYVGPVLGRYLGNLQDSLRRAGYRNNVLIMQSHGGIASIAEAIRLAAGSVLSGPAGGVAGGRFSARIAGESDLITFDMGGTSTDISLIVDGACQLAFERGVGGEKVALPSLEILTLGAGGGSIARVDAGSILRVGPQSAGALPGPACYGRGGHEATVTDANLVLGYLDAERFADGAMKLDREAAGQAVERIARQLGSDRIAAARGIFTVVNTAMAEGIRLVSIKRGHDARRFTLLSFGGAAGVHVTDLSRRLGIERVIVPRIASLLSAWGMLTTDLRHEIVQTHIGDIHELEEAELRDVLMRLEADGRARISTGFHGTVDVHRSLDMRYGEQMYSTNVAIDALDLTAPNLLAQAVSLFHKRHEDLYTYSLPDRDVALVNARVAVVGRLPDLPEEPVLAEHRQGGAHGKRRIYLDDWQTVPVYDLHELGPEESIAGPCLIEAPTTTVLLDRGDAARVTRNHWLDIRVRQNGRGEETSSSDQKRHADGATAGS